MREAPIQPLLLIKIIITGSDQGPFLARRQLAL